MPGMPVMTLEDGVAVVGWYRPSDVLSSVPWAVIPAVVLTMLGSLSIAYAYPRIDMADPLSIRQVYSAAEIEEGQHRRPRPDHIRGENENMTLVWIAFFGGLLLVVSGPATMIWSMRRRWQDDRYLMLRVDGLLVQDHERFSILWESVSRVRWDDGDDSIVLEMRDEDDAEVRIGQRYMGITNQDLAREAEAVRRKASFGLL